MNKTINCVICRSNPATVWGGHVHLDGKIITAGRCADHSHIKMLESSCPGCFGQHHPDMGITILKQGRPITKINYQEQYRRLESLCLTLLENSAVFHSAIEIYHTYDGETWEKSVRAVIEENSENPKTMFP